MSELTQFVAPSFDALAAEQRDTIVDGIKGVDYDPGQPIIRIAELN